MEVKRHTLAWAANVEVGRLEERCGAGSVEAAVQDEWTGMEERKKNWSWLSIDSDLSQIWCRFWEDKNQTNSNSR